MSRCMPISLDTLRLPARRFPSIFTMTRSAALILPLLMQVGVTSSLVESRRTERLPSVAATNPLSCSQRPNCTISLRCWRSLIAAVIDCDSGRGSVVDIQTCAAMLQHAPEILQGKAGQEHD